jgi:DNA-binding GntR family transcriptional regulator
MSSIGLVNHERLHAIKVDSGSHRLGKIVHGDHVTIDYEGETPLWRQLADLLRAQIESGELAAGRMLPSETTLVQRFGLARGTVRKAIESLAAEGLVRRVQGRGTFVASR